MDAESFRKYGAQTVDYIADYLENVGSMRRVVPTTKPGSLAEKLPTSPPQAGEPFDAIFKDFRELIMPAVLHWMHPHFHAYYPSGNSYASLLGSLLSNALGTVNFSWAANPASTELELMMVQWLGAAIALPASFLPFTPHGRGGGVIQMSSSEATLIAFMAARRTALERLQRRASAVQSYEDDEADGAKWLPSMVAYCSKVAHSNIRKVCSLVGLIKLHVVDTDASHRMRGDALAQAIQDDIDAGLEPTFVFATLGTVSCCSFDVLTEIGPVCDKHDLWLHVDAAYAGSAFICPEYQHLLKGIEYAMSCSVSPHKLLLVSVDCVVMWVRDRYKLIAAQSVNPLYLKHSWLGDAEAVDYRNWCLACTRRFRSLKLWFVMRTYGVEGLQQHIRNHVRLAGKFAQLVAADERFELKNEPIMGLVVFRIKGENALTQELLQVLTASARLYLVPSSLDGCFCIRFCINSADSQERHVTEAWRIICSAASILLAAATKTRRIPLVI